MTDLGMAGKCRGKGAAGAPDEKSVLPLLSFRETSQLSQHRQRLIYPVPQLANRYCLTGGYPMPHFAQGVTTADGGSRSVRTSRSIRNSVP